jgi:hypothetical protein
MKLLGRMLATALILVIVPLFMLSACNLAFERTMRDPATYTHAFENQNVYDDLLPVALPAIFQAAGTGGKHIEGLPVEYRDITTTLDSDDWRVITSELVPPQWLKAQFEQSVNTALSLLNNDFSVLERPVDLSDLKARLSGDEAQRAAEYIITTAPDCTAEQNARLQSMGTDASALLPVCNPADVTLRATSIHYIVTWLDQVGQLLPEGTVTIQEFYQVPRTAARLVYLVGQLSSQVVSLLYLTGAALCALIVFFTVRSLKSFGRWLGLTILLTGMGILLVLVLLQFALVGFIRELVTTSSDLERFAASILSALSRSITAGAGSTILLQAAIFIGIGFVLLAISFLVRAPDDGLVPVGSVIMSEDGKIISAS